MQGLTYEELKKENEKLRIILQNALTMVREEARATKRPTLAFLYGMLKEVAEKGN